MRKILLGLEDVAYYYDDVLIASTRWEQHCEVLREVLRRIKDAGLTIKPAKCELEMREVSFLGDQVRAGEMSPLTATLEEIQNARPEKKKQVRSFLELTGYYRDFIPGYATLTCPLSDLTRKGQPTAVVQWGSAQEDAFVKLKKL